MISPSHIFLKTTLLVVCILNYFLLYSQNPDDILVSTECNEIFRVNVKTCEATLVIKNNIQLLDIAINPIDGRLYGVEGNGTLWLMNTNSGSSNIIGNTVAGMNALTFSSQGILYGMSRFELDLYQIDPSTGNTVSLGTMDEPSFSSGDLNFYRGDLYMFALDRRVVKINLDDVPRSRTISRTSLGDVFGATSAGCDSRFYVSSDFNLYEIADLMFLSPKTVCTDVVPCTIFGATSLVESVNNLNLGPDRLLCADESLILYATPDAISYKWQDGSNGSSFIVKESGTYFVELTNVCGTLSDTVVVEFNDYPEVEVTEDQIFCKGRTVTLEASSGNEEATFRWNTGNTNSSIEVGSPGFYEVNVSVDNCITTGSILVEEEICETILELPNVFTPNNDELNELFIPIRIEEVKSMTTFIFDRTGNKILETEELAIRWNGKLPNGNDASDGVYFWWIKYTNFLNQTKEIRGTVTLSR